MIFSKDLITQGVQLTRSQSIDFYATLSNLPSNNVYQVRLTIGEARFHSSSQRVPVQYYNGEQYLEKVYYPTFLQISQTVDGNTTSKTIDIVDTSAYYSSSPYFNLINSFYALEYNFSEQDFIQQFFSVCPDFVPEVVLVSNPVVSCLPQTRGYFNYLNYYVNTPNLDLYLDPLDNSNQFQLLNSLNQVAGTHLSSDDYHDIMAIEAYNRNYLLAHLQPNVSGNLDVTGYINASTSSSSGGSSSVDLSGVVNQLQNISNKLTYTHSNNVSADLSELLYYVAEAIQYGLTYDDEQQHKHSFLDDLNKKLEYTEIVVEEEVTKNISQLVSELSQKLQDLSDRPIINTNEDLSPWSAV